MRISIIKLVIALTSATITAACAEPKITTDPATPTSDQPSGVATTVEALGGACGNATDCARFAKCAPGALLGCSGGECIASGLVDLTCAASVAAGVCEGIAESAATAPPCSAESRDFGGEWAAAWFDAWSPSTGASLKVSKLRVFAQARDGSETLVGEGGLNWLQLAKWSIWALGKNDHISLAPSMDLGAALDVTGDLDHVVHGGIERFRLPSGTVEVRVEGDFEGSGASVVFGADTLSAKTDGKLLGNSIAMGRWEGACGGAARATSPRSDGSCSTPSLAPTPTAPAPTAPAPTPSPAPTPTAPASLSVTGFAAGESVARGTGVARTVCWSGTRDQIAVSVESGGNEWVTFERGREANGCATAPVEVLRDWPLGSTRIIARATDGTTGATGTFFVTDPTPASPPPAPPPAPAPSVVQYKASGVPDAASPAVVDFLGLELPMVRTADGAFTVATDAATAPRRFDVRWNCANTPAWDQSYPDGSIRWCTTSGFWGTPPTNHVHGSVSVTVDGAPMTVVPASDDARWTF